MRKLMSLIAVVTIFFCTASLKASSETEKVAGNQEALARNASVHFDGTKERVGHPSYSGVFLVGHEDKVLASWVEPGYNVCNMKYSGTGILNVALPDASCERVPSRHFTRRMVTNSYRVDGVEGRKALVRSETIVGVGMGLLGGFMAAFLVMIVPALAFHLTAFGFWLGILGVAAVVASVGGYRARKFAKSFPNELKEVSYSEEITPLK